MAFFHVVLKEQDRRYPLGSLVRIEPPGRENRKEKIIFDVLRYLSRHLFVCPSNIIYIKKVRVGVFTLTSNVHGHVDLATNSGCRPAQRLWPCQGVLE
jgi:hypothetical protein